MEPTDNAGPAELEDAVLELTDDDASPELITRLTEVLASTENIRAEIVRENKKRDIRIRNSRVAIALAILVGVVGIGVGRSGVSEAAKAKAEAKKASVALAVSIANTKEARIASCQNSNLSELKQAKAEKDEERSRQAESSVALDRLLTLLNLSHEDLHKLQAEHLKKYDATVDAAHPLRDCSPDGIARYLKSK